LNESADPNLPEALQDAPLIVPLLPLPDWSPTLDPDASLKLYRPTGPPVGGGGSGVVDVAVKLTPVLDAPLIATEAVLGLNV
jgi:hypothetical protein